MRRLRSARRALQAGPWTAGAALLLLATGPSSAQEIPPAAAVPHPAHGTARAPSGTPDAVAPPVRPPRLPAGESRAGAAGGDPPGPLRVFGASLIVPGSGQWMLGSGRSYLYLGLEIVGWAAYLDRRSGGARLRDRYRDLAWEVARSGSGSPRIVGGFAYYEAMARFPASGAWDADPDRPGLQPESDPATHNGSVWLLARQLYLAGEEDDPSSEARERALAHYREHGYPPELAWDWRRDPAAAERYRSLLDRSDARFRAATLALGAIVANHLLSAVDGYVSVRVGSDAIRDPRPPTGAPPLRAVGRWSLEVRLPTER